MAQESLSLRHEDGYPPGFSDSPRFHFGDIDLAFQTDPQGRHLRTVALGDEAHAEIVIHYVERGKEVRRAAAGNPQ